MVQYLKQLLVLGVIYIELLLVFDLVMVNEFSDKVVDIQQLFSCLCEVNSVVKSSEFVGYCDSGLMVEEVLIQLKQNDSKDNLQVQVLNMLVVQIDFYNWGYDLFYYMVLEGFYVIDLEGMVCIKEFCIMIQVIKQDLGMNVIMDVVYNYINVVGLIDCILVLDKIVFWYYQCLNEIIGSVELVICCFDLVLEYWMFVKFIVDLLVVWIIDYKIDGFCFDLMGYYLKVQIFLVWECIKVLNLDIYFFGEGWDFNQSDCFEIVL